MKAFTLLFVAVATGFCSCAVGNSYSTPILVTDFNSFVDLLLESIQQDPTQFHLNPYEVATVTDSFPMGLISGELILSNGKIYGAKSVYRYADATAVIDNNQMVTVTLVLGFKNLTYTVDYSLQLGLVSTTGKAHGDMKDILANIVLVADMKNTSDVTAVLKDFNFISTGVITAHVDTNNALTTAVENAMSTFMLTMFKDQVVHGFQKDMATAVNTTVVSMHVDMSG